jgi:hypothetical protein
MTIRCLSRTIGVITAATGISSVGAQGQCLRLSSDSTPIASIFVAELLQRRPYKESISFGQSQSQWPMVELALKVSYGWKERPRIVPSDPDSDTLRIRIRPDQDPELPVGALLVAFMTRVYMQEIILRPPDPPTPPRPVGLGWLVPAAGGLCALEGVRAELASLGTPHWQRSSP